MVVWQVARDSNGDRDFKGMYHGTHLRTGFHNNWVGQSMADTIPVQLRSAALSGANYCAEHSRGIYMVYMTADTVGHRIDCERMLLPFGTPQQGVQQIVASMEVISLTGDVNLSKALAHFTAGFQVETAAWFKPRLFPNRG